MEIEISDELLKKDVGHISYIEEIKVKVEIIVDPKTTELKASRVIASSLKEAIHDLHENALCCIDNPPEEPYDMNDENVRDHFKRNPELRP